MSGFYRCLKLLGITLGLGVLFVLLLGIYRFNFTSDDIYLQQPDGSVVPYEAHE